MTKISQTAFILGAGFGKRLRPYTEHMPKPMVEVGGRPMIDHALDQLHEAGIKKTVVNTHYKAEVLHDHLKDRTNPHVIISHEPDILDTGGGLKNALKYFDNQPFIVVSGDSLWTDPPNSPALKEMIDFWDSDKMDILILLQPVETMTATKGVGDYDFITDQSGCIKRSHTQTGKYMWTSIRIHHPRIFENTPDTPFSYLDCMDKAEQEGRLYGIIHTGMWHHISTPDDLEAVRAIYDKTPIQQAG